MKLLFSWLDTPNWTKFEIDRAIISASQVCFWFRGLDKVLQFDRMVTQISGVENPVKLVEFIDLCKI